MLTTRERPTAEPVYLIGGSDEPKVARALRLVELVGENAFALEAEAEKIAAWAGGDPVGIREVEALATPLAETSIWALANAWGARDVASVLSAAEARLRLGDEPFLIAVRLASYIGRVRSVQALVEADVELREIGRRLGFKFPPKREVGYAANYAQDEIGAAIVRLGELDFALKGGSRLDPELELERALVEITAPARAATPAAAGSASR